MNEKFEQFKEISLTMHNLLFCSTPTSMLGGADTCKLAVSAASEELSPSDEAEAMAAKRLVHTFLHEIEDPFNRSAIDKEM